MPSTRIRLNLAGIILILLSTLAFMPPQPALAACWSTSCHGKDPTTEGCDINIQNGASTTIWGVMTVQVRKSTACGGVKWPKASRDINYTGGTFQVWLEDANGNVLSGTSYTGLASDMQIYGDMWTGAVKACAKVTTYSANKVCSGLDP